MIDKNRIIVALDFAQGRDALTLVRKLDPELCRLKVGKELFTSSGPEIVKELVKLNFDVFLDLKFHDIPHTVAKACLAASKLGVWMLNVHASGGRSMLVAAKKALSGLERPPLLIAVTVLTSLDETELQEIGFTGSAAENALRLAQLAQQCQLDGVVCSALEAGIIREHLQEAFRLVTPGIRPTGAAQNDQLRIMTPAQALQAGADYLVIGRPIIAAADPLQALMAIRDEVNTALSVG